MPADGRLRPSLRDTCANLRAAAPLAALRGLFANSWRKARSRTNCCGRYGDPGC